MRDPERIYEHDARSADAVADLGGFDQGRDSLLVPASSYSLIICSAAIITPVEQGTKVTYTCTTILEVTYLCE